MLMNISSDAGAEALTLLDKLEVVFVRVAKTLSYAVDVCCACR